MPQTPAPVKVPRDGAPERLAQLVARDGARLRRAARALARSEADADELVQMAYERALRRPELLAGDRPCRRLADHMSDDARTMRSRAGRLVPLEAELAGDPGPGSRLERRASVASALEALAELGSERARLLVLLGEGRSVTEVADLLGRREEAVKTAARRARAEAAARRALIEEGARCKRVRRHLAPYLAGTLPPPRADAVAAHLRRCRGACRYEAARLGRGAA